MQGQEAGQPIRPQISIRTVDARRSPTVASRLGDITGANSLWRFPSMPGKMPRYLERRFRLKTLGLMALQLACVFGIMVLIDHFGVWELIRLNLATVFQEQILFYCLGFIDLVCVMVMYCLKDTFPWNYMMLAVTTIVSGVFWGLTRIVVVTTLHFQIVGILTCTMLVGAALSWVLEKQECQQLSSIRVVLGSLAAGWTLGSIADVVIMHTVFEDSSLVVLGAVGFSFLLLVILLLDAGKFLVRCRPDDFLTVIVAMNSTLLVVVSIPFFVLSFCFLHAGDAMEDEVDAQAAPEANTIGQARGPEEV
eukprot:TRINITY_DN35605_c0_g1_i2.p1 TRINITY_DN35605_c0_g1~~TRINITY_DN35605_c0_g1_i2.p1  ORF type:complete len:354 (-),score=59.27 TRINITY_DN35605_c0_g1_i2:134-1054(-)